MSSSPDKLYNDFKNLLVDVGSSLAPVVTEDGSDIGARAGENKLFQAIFNARNSSIYTPDLVEKWAADAANIQALLGAIRENAKDAETLTKLRGVGSLELTEKIDVDFNPPQVLKLAFLPERFITDKLRKNASGTGMPAALERQFAAKVVQALTELHALGIPVRVLSAYRSRAAQIAAAKTNPSAAEANRSNHRFGLAIDVTPEGSRQNPIVKRIMNKHGLQALLEGAREDNHWSTRGN